MAQWYHSNRRLFREERKALAAFSPLMMLSVVSSGFQLNSELVTLNECAIAHGTHILKTPGINVEIEYGISLLLPDNYPESFPILLCNDSQLPNDSLDRHITEGGQACLEVGPEIRRRWPPGSNIVDFIVKLVEPFLAWQVYYDAFGTPPEWGGREHGSKGIIEYYANLIGLGKDSNVLDFMKLLSRKNRPKGHEMCPCNSGLKLRDCHREALYRGSDKVFWADVKRDVDACLKFGKPLVR